MLFVICPHSSARAVARVAVVERLLYNTGAGVRKEHLLYNMEVARAARTSAMDVNRQRHVRSSVEAIPIASRER